MPYKKELEFTCRLLSHFQIKTHFVSDNTTDVSHIDLGLRSSLGLGKDYDNLMKALQNNLKENVIHKYTDSFFCTYMLIKLPDSEKNITMIIGPYTLIDITQNFLMELLEKNGVMPQLLSRLERYFHNIPFMESESTLIVLMNTLGESLWGNMENYRFELLDMSFIEKVTAEDFMIHRILKPADKEKSSDTILKCSFETEDSGHDMKVIEERYDWENQLLKTVSSGLIHKAEMLMNRFAAAQYEKRATDPVRNIQNYCVILNTLLRKAAEHGSVHPFYIDSLSSDFAHRIEQVASVESAKKLQRDMVHKYCLLVKNHSMKGYSLLVQKVITFIDSDLTADLSLNAIAGNLNVNASYLSTLFKRETSSTLTDYVNEKRIQHGILLLHSTRLQIQTIATYCGIPDVNYFTKLFKKKVGKTPKEYRENFLKGTGNMRI